MSDGSLNQCVVCAQSSQDAPLIHFHFRGRDHWICTQHLPVLIHDPQRLAAHLPGSGQLSPSEHHD